MPVPQPLVSVVLCTYNGAAYLEQQLESIAAQTLCPFELIACDDGSTDATLEILYVFQSRAPFSVKVIRNPMNLGSTANFDQAMQLAVGEFIALSDQDDVWLPEKLARLAAILEADTALGGAFSDARLLSSSGRTEAVLKKSLWSKHGFNTDKQTAFAERSAAIALLLKVDVVTGATLVVRASLRPLWHPIPNSWMHDGWITWMLAVHSRIAPIAEPLILYRLHGQQQVGVGSSGNFAERVRAVRQNERARYARVAGQFEDLLKRLRMIGVDKRLEEQLLEKIALLRRRSQLPSSAVKRVIVIFRSVSAYQRYARGWRSMRKDLLLD